MRDHPDEVAQLLELGSQLRGAQEDLDGQELRTLNGQRHDVLTAVTQQARAVAAQHGHVLSDAVARQVESTLRAALADEGAALAVRSGLLVAHLQVSGFSPANLEGAVAVPDIITDEQLARIRSHTGPRTARMRTTSRRLARAGREVEETEKAQAAAAEQLRGLEQLVAHIGARQKEFAATIEELTARLQEVREQDKQAAREARAAGRERDEAAKVKRTADRDAAKARARLDRFS